MDGAAEVRERPLMVVRRDDERRGVTHGVADEADEPGPGAELERPMPPIACAEFVRIVDNATGERSRCAPRVAAGAAGRDVLRSSDDC